MLTRFNLLVEERQPYGLDLPVNVANNKREVLVFIRCMGLIWNLLKEGCH
jgi:hypothetical protein